MLDVVIKHFYSTNNDYNSQSTATELFAYPILDECLPNVVYMGRKFGGQLVYHTTDVSRCEDRVIYLSEDIRQSAANQHSLPCSISNVFLLTFRWMYIIDILYIQYIFTFHLPYTNTDKSNSPFTSRTPTQINLKLRCDKPK